MRRPRNLTPNPFPRGKGNQKKIKRANPEENKKIRRANAGENRKKMDDQNGFLFPFRAQALGLVPLPARESPIISCSPSGTGKPDYFLCPFPLGKGLGVR